MMKAKYTMYLHTIMNDSEGRKLLDDALSTYPMYKPAHPVTYTVMSTREQLNQKILNHFEFREIGFETVGRFLKELKNTMEEIMPYYYSLYKSVDIMNSLDDPFGNVDIIEKFTQTTTGNTSTTIEHSDNRVDNQRNVKTDTPQSEINVSDIDDMKYASEINWNKNQGESSSNDNSMGSSSGTTEHTFTKTGNQGVNTYAHDMVELRTVFINVDQMILNDERLQELFMMVY